MNLSFIHPFIYRYPRGIERYTLNLGNALAQQNTAVNILTWRWPRPVHWPEHDSNLDIRIVPTPRYYAARLIVPFYVAHLWRHRYDMVYIHFADYGEASTLKFLASLNRAQPFTIVFHFPYSQVPHRYETLAKTGLVERADRLIAVSDFVAREAEDFLGRSCTVISHGVDTSLFKPDSSQRSQVRAELGLEQASPLLLTVAALEERKGVKWVLRSLPQILNHFPQVTYLVVGSGPYLESLKALTAELKLEQRVQFLPARADVARYYQAADLMLIPAKGEASSITSLEALACGLPVIASQHPPFDELIASEWGCQIDETSVEALADIVVELLSDRQRRRTMGQAGREYILQEHTWSGIANQYLSLLRS